MSELLEYARQYLALRVAKTMAVISPASSILRGGTPALVEWMTLHVPQAKVVMNHRHSALLLRAEPRSRRSRYAPARACHEEGPGLIRWTKRRRFLFPMGVIIL